MKSTANIAATMALLSGAADAFWRMPCQSRSGLARMDPIVEPDQIANHAHAIHGGSGFNMKSTYEDLMASECTSCRVTQDKSAYWTPSLNFIHENGTTEIVPQVGGMLAYYLLFGEDLKAFPAGFRMLAGDTRNRNFSGAVPDPEKSLWTAEDKTQRNLGQKAIGMNCLNYDKPPEGSMYRHFLPDKEYMDANCKHGIRAELFFPSCWNGKDLDSDNHRDHMAYPDLVNTGSCPEGFDIRLPSLFFETIWDTNTFNGLPGQFVFANGDPTGYGYHGDFVAGWDVDFLQQAVNTCTNPSGQIEDCAIFDIQPEADAAKCQFKVPEVLSAENCAGPMDGLCGNVPVQDGPAYASLLQPGNTESPTAITPVLTTPAAVPTLSFKGPATAATDQYGGGISLGNAQVSVGPDVPEETKPVDTPAVPTAGGPAFAPSAVDSSPAPAAPPAVTPAPAPADPAAPKGSIISTSIYTTDGTVYEIAIEQVAVTVTVEAPAAPPARRHVHHMHRRDKEHGLLGRY